MLNLTREQRRCARQGGFTLVELIVVMAIMSIVMMAVMSLLIPAVRSTSVQTKVSDVQSNLRLAMNRMTKDLILAGLLVKPGYTSGGAATGAIFWEPVGSPNPATDLTIRTRTVGDAFARIISNSNTGKLGLSDVDMLAAFPVGTSLRLFDGMRAMEFASLDVAGYDEESSSAFVYTVTANDSTSSTIDGVVCPANLTISQNFPSGVLREAVALKIRDNTQPPMQTIRYRVNNGALERIVNGSTQHLARNVASVLFEYQNSATGAVKRVDITLTGQPVGLAGGGAESSTKNRSLYTSVALRNVY